MPAVTLQNSTTQSSQNWGVRIASRGGHVAARHERLVALAVGRPAFRTPAVGGHSHRERPEHHQHEVDGAERQERRRDGVRGVVGEGAQQRVRQRRGDQRAAAEAHDREPRREPRTVREPLDQRRDGRDVADSQPDAADDAVAEVHEPELGRRDAERADHEARAPAAGGDEHRLPRAAALDPRAADRGRQSQHHDRDAEDDPDRRQLCVEVLDQRLLEDAERVHLADREMHRQRRRRDQPAAVAGRCHGPFTIKQL